MSFSAEIKEELSRIRLRAADQRRALLAGLTQTCGSLRLSRSPEVLYQSESEAVIRMIAQLGPSVYDVDATVAQRMEAHRRTPLSVVTFAGTDCRKILVDSGVLHEEDEGFSFIKEVPNAIVSDPECRRLFLRGAFLGSGSCSAPNTGYHLEIVCRTETFAEELIALIGTFGPKAKKTERKGREIVYCKGDDVAGFLALIGANSAALAFENARTERDFRNYLNRTSNCETANIDKTVTAGLQQLRAIEAIEGRMPLTDLPAPLYEAARLRLQHPDATLQELADMAEIGKSGMNHRLARLIRLSKELP